MTEFAGQSGTNKKLLIAVIGLSAVLVVVLGVFAISQLFGDSKADDVFATCSESNSGLTIDDDTLRIEMPGGERSIAYTRARTCLVSETEMPPHIEDRMMWTSASVGKDDGRWGGWKASWTYSVEDGLVLSVTSD
ncbi:hypothetical protein [Rhodococcus qingshengii]|uniref:Uncharacterized protein n=1 Tax=Rhodococcus qingshengii TaxID=334542 RepID=A0A2A5J4E6_RHOSG|nr:hypothetical protein [Rhodococcus qingshengii]PCK24393.1 hypothetical protein CHR55_26245 [Rhodococcus qingshengii]